MAWSESQILELPIETGEDPWKTEGTSAIRHVQTTQWGCPGAGYQERGLGMRHGFGSHWGLDRNKRGSPQYMRANSLELVLREVCP